MNDKPKWQVAHVDDIESIRLFNITKIGPHPRYSSLALSTHALLASVSPELSAKGPVRDVDMEGWHDAEVHTYRRLGCNPGRMR